MRLPGSTESWAWGRSFSCCFSQEYTTTNFHMAPGSRLTFYSDGVVEAANSKGEMFGFARAQACSSQSPDAIVEAAQQFGQNDDITVVTIEREALQAVAA